MRSKLATLVLATLATGGCLLAAASPASATTSQYGKSRSISSESGWQNAGVYVEPGDRVVLYSVGGRWTVDYRKFPYVSGGGYSWRTDHRIYQGCKILNGETYGTLIARINGDYYKVGRSASIRARSAGFLQLRINDNCLGDNDGSVRVKISVTD